MQIIEWNYLCYLGLNHTFSRPEEDLATWNQKTIMASLQERMMLIAMKEVFSITESNILQDCLQELEIRENILL